MNVFSYFPRRRHLNRGKDGRLCVGCMKPFRHFLPLWAHKIRRRHPFVGDGVVRHCDVVDGVAVPRDATFRWRLVISDHHP